MVVPHRMVKYTHCGTFLSKISLFLICERKIKNVVFASPVKIDENEFWVLLGLVILLTIFIRLPRHFPPALTFTLLTFNAFLAITVDYTLAGKYPFDFYDALDTAKYDLFDLIMDMINYSIIGYIFMYFYDKLKLTTWSRILYFLFWIGLSVLLEWFSVKLHVFKFIHWNFRLSTIAYVFIFLYYIAVLKLGKTAMYRFEENLKGHE